MTTHTEKLPMVEKACYGLGDLASCLFWQTITIYLLFFYTDVFGLAAVAAGTMIAVSRLLDALFDVVIGMFADRTTTRWGKFRPYILWGALPLAISAVLAFSTPSFGGAPKIVYAYVTFIAFMFLYSAVNIPYTSLLGVISGDPVERTSASSFKFIGAYLGGLIVSATALPLVKYIAGRGGQTTQDIMCSHKLMSCVVKLPDSGVMPEGGLCSPVMAKAQAECAAHGWQLTLAAYGIASVILFFITFVMTKERVQPVAKEKTPILADLRDLSRNVPWMVLFAATILFILFVCIRMSVTTHYFKYYIGEQNVDFLGIRGRYGFEALASAFNTVGQAMSLVGVILVPSFAKWLGRKRALVVLMVASIVSTGSFYFFGPENLVLILFFQIVGSLTGGPISALLWVLYADTADHSEWKTGRRATGLVFSASIMSNKIGWTVGTLVASVMLELTGFVANQGQSEAVKEGLKAMMSVIPVVAGLITLGILVFFYKLDEPLMARVKAELDARRKQQAQSEVPVEQPSEMPAEA